MYKIHIDDIFTKNDNDTDITYSFIHPHAPLCTTQHSYIIERNCIELCRKNFVVKVFSTFIEAFFLFLLLLLLLLLSCCCYLVASCKYTRVIHSIPLQEIYATFFFHKMRKIKYLHFFLYTLCVHSICMCGGHTCEGVSELLQINFFILFCIARFGLRCVLWKVYSSNYRFTKKKTKLCARSH